LYGERVWLGNRPRTVRLNSLDTFCFVWYASRQLYLRGSPPISRNAKDLNRLSRLDAGNPPSPCEDERLNFERRDPCVVSLNVLNDLNGG
jgi:hypothetical protein